MTAATVETESSTGISNGLVAGIDVGKSRLDPPVGGGEVHSFACVFEPGAEGIAAMLEWLAEQGAGLVVCEPAGGCGEPLAGSLRQARIPVHLAHPNKVRAFAQASGRLAKTGRLDAQVISRYGQVFGLQEVSQPEPEREEVPALLRRRRQLADQRVEELNRLDRAWNPAVRASAQRHIDWLDQEIEALDQAYREALESSGEMSRQADLCRSVPGIGELTAAILVADRGGPAGIGPRRGQGTLLPGGAGSLVQGQRQTAGIPGRSRRTQRGAPGPLYGGPLHHPQTRGAAELLSGAAPERETRQGGPGGGDAKTAAANPRHRAPRHTLEPQSHPALPHAKSPTQPLTNNTDTPPRFKAGAGIQRAADADFQQCNVHRFPLSRE